MFVIPTLTRGGAERVVSVISSALAEQDRQVVVIKYYEEENEYPISTNVRIINLSNGDRNQYTKIKKIGLIRKLREAVKFEQPDFIIPFMLSVSLLTTIATIGIRVNVLQSIRIDLVNAHLSKWEKLLQKILVYRSNLTFVQNEQQKQYFNKKYHEKIHILFNPVDPSFFAVQHKGFRDKFTFSAIGRLVKQKNYDLLIDAFFDAFYD